jgi:hypothetical protein
MFLVRDVSRAVKLPPEWVLANWRKTRETFLALGRKIGLTDTYQ